MKEKDIQSDLTEFLQNQLSLYNNGAYELKLVKLSKDKSMAFDRVAEHQENSLLDVKHRGLQYKIRDIGQNKKPFDFFIMRELSAYIVICFYEERKRKTLYFIDIDTFINYKASSIKKSINEHECKAIAERTVDILGKNQQASFPESERQLPIEIMTNDNVI